MYNGKSTPIQLVPPGSVSSPFNSFNIFHSLSSGEGIDIWKKYLQTVFEKSDCFLDEKATSVWIVSKELQSGKLFSDYFGKNEKSKFIVKLQKRGGGAPQREPVISGEEHKSMLSYYHKKQEEVKELEVDN